MSEPAPQTPAAPTVIIIAGPTASGKSAVALDLARQINGTVINADSLQIYKDLPILTAQPDLTAQEIRDIPHRLYGVLPPQDTIDAISWRDLAVAEIRASAAAGRIPIVVGGTGFYLKTLMEGLSPIPEIPPEVRIIAQDLKDRLGVTEFYNFLIAEDPSLEGNIDPQNPQRLVRAYEVFLATGRSLTYWQSLPKSGPPQGMIFDLRILMPDRETLYHNCNTRFEAMIDQGALREVEAFDTRILKGEIGPHGPLTHALGFQPLQAHLRGEMDLETAITLAQNETRHYAKRQATWFRHQL